MLSLKLEPTDVESVGRKGFAASAAFEGANVIGLQSVSAQLGSANWNVLTFESSCKPREGVLEVFLSKFWVYMYEIAKT